MKYPVLLILLATAVLANGYSTSTVMEATPEGIFATHPAGPWAAPFDIPEPDIQDSELLWHYSVSSGLIQKICPMGDEAGFVFTGGWYGGGKMFYGIGGDGSVLWETEPELGPNLYWKNLATGTEAAWTGDGYYLVRVFDVWNDNGTPGTPGDDYPVSEDNTEVCFFEGASSTPVWTWDGTGQFIAAAPDEPGKYECTSNGEYFAVGGYNDGHLAVAVFVPDSANPVLLWEEPGTAYSPRQLRITEDGSKVIFSVAADMMRLDVATGTLDDTYSLGASTDCFDISADGSLVAYGFTSVRLAEWDGSQYNLAWSYGISGFYAGAAAISDDNQAVYFGAYRNTYLSNRILRFDPSSSTPLWTYDTPTGSGSYQDVVSWMATTPEGQYLVASFWGCQAGGGDEVIVLDDDSPSAPFYSIDTPGSMWHCDISPDGTYITAAGKHVHANVMGSGADVYMADCTPEGLEGSPAGGTLRLIASPNPSSGMASIGFSLPAAGNVEISIFDLTGRRVEQVTAGSLSEGEHAVPVSADLPSGLYIVNLSFEGMRISEKLVISR